MAIHKKQSFRILVFAVLIIFLLTVSNVCASELSARKMLHRSYNIGETLSKDQASNLVDLLKKESGTISNNYLLSRINYRAGLLYYKASMFDDAVVIFLETAGNDKFCSVIRAACCNMAAIIYKQQGRYFEAIKQFEKIVSLTVDDYKLNDKSTASILQLGILGLFNIAEIHQIQGNNDLAIDAYGRLLGILSYSREVRFRKYIPIAKDRLAQLYLAKKQVSKYIVLCRSLLADFPDYYRWSLIRFEMYCIKAIEEITGSEQLPDTSYQAGARLTAIFKNTPEKEKLADYVAQFKSEISGEINNYAQLLKYYYCCWLLDSAGEKKSAYKALQAIDKCDLNNISADNLESIIVAVDDYAKIFQAIILIEEGHYRRVQDVLVSIKSGKDQPHISKLVDSIRENAEILRRETIVDDK